MEEENAAMQTAAFLGAEQTTEGSAEKTVKTPEKVGKPKVRRAGKRVVLLRLRENIGAISKDLLSFRKNDESSAKRLEKQVSQMHSEVTSLKSVISKESVDAMKKQEAYVSKILAKLESKPKKKGRSKK